MKYNETLNSLKDKKFKSISNDEYGGIKIEFKDGTIAYFEITTYPDRTVSDIYLNAVKTGKKNE